MSNPRAHDELARAVFAGLSPTAPAPIDRLSAPERARTADRESSRLSRGVMATMPLVLAGAMTVSMNLTGPIEPATAQPKKQGKPQSSTTPVARGTVAAATVAAASSKTPSTYRVKAGDTVSSIAARYGLSTASVLTLNGLGWKSLIFPGQVLKLTKASSSSNSTPKPATPVADGASTTYTIKRGDTISGIAGRFGVTTQKVLSANGLGWSSVIYPGQKITIPGKSPAASSPAPSAPADEPSLDIDEISQVTPATPFFHTVVAGDTISRIAAKHGSTTQKVLDANDLKSSSIIYPGQKILIPGKTGSAPAGSAVTPLTSEMAANARTIIDVGRSLGVSDRGIVIALATAMQESSLRNLDYGDRDSVGLFQQRPSAGWGTVAQLTTPSHAAKLFYGGPKNPNKGKTRGLLDISGWQGMTLTQAAQAVQISAYPNAYAKWETSAWAWFAQLG